MNTGSYLILFSHGRIYSCPYYKSWMLDNISFQQGLFFIAYLHIGVVKRYHVKCHKNGTSHQLNDMKTWRRSADSCRSSKVHHSLLAEILEHDKVMKITNKIVEIWCTGRSGLQRKQSYNSKIWFCERLKSPWGLLFCQTEEAVTWEVIQSYRCRWIERQSLLRLQRAKYIEQLSETVGSSWTV